jgi:hypothetical protein
MTPGTSAAGGRCANHPDRESVSTCARCGNFMCTTCSAGGSEPFCPSCRQRTGMGAFPFHRDDFSFDRLWNFTFEAWKKQWVMLSVAILALGGIYMAGIFVMQIFIGGGTAVLAQAGRGDKDVIGALAGLFAVLFVGYLILALVMGVGFIGILRMCCDALLGKTVDFGTLFSQFSKAGRAVALLLMMMGITMIPIVLIGGGMAGAIAAAVAAAKQAGESSRPEAIIGSMIGLMSLGYLVLIIAIIWISLPFTFAMLELAHSNAGAVECLKRGYSLSKGFRLQIFGYRLLGGVLIMVGMIACCVGALPATALAYMLETSLYLAVRNGSGLPNFES